MLHNQEHQPIACRSMCCALPIPSVLARNKSLRGGAAASGTAPAPVPPTPAPPGQADPAGPSNIHGGTQKSLLQPAQQWQAHETTISSVEGANYRGKVDLLVTAGVDCYIHLWTVAGAHIGTFGQVGPAVLVMLVVVPTSPSNSSSSSSSCGAPVPLGGFVWASPRASYRSTSSTTHFLVGS